MSTYNSEADVFVDVQGINPEVVMHNMDTLMLKEQINMKNRMPIHSPVISANVSPPRSFRPRHQSDDHSATQRLGHNLHRDGFYTPVIDTIRLQKPPYTAMPRSRRLEPTVLEQKLDEVRKKFEKKRAIDDQLGLTSCRNSPFRSPFGEAIDIKELREDELGFRRNTFWKSCCGQVIDRRATKFFVQVTIGVCVMGFCMAKIWNAEPENCTGESTLVYFSLISAIVGFYIPSLSMHKQ